MNIIIFGPPSSGKSTFSRRIAATSGIKYINAGELARQEIEKESELGKELQRLISIGRPFPPKVLLPTILNKILECNPGFILDGYPRNLEEVGLLTGELMRRQIDIDEIILLNIPLETCSQRMMMRTICTSCDHTFGPLNPSSPCPNCGNSTLQRRTEDNPKRFELRWAYYDTWKTQIVAQLSRSFGAKVITLSAEEAESFVL